MIEQTIARHFPRTGLLPYENEERTISNEIQIPLLKGLYLWRTPKLSSSKPVDINLNEITIIPEISKPQSSRHQMLYHYLSSVLEAGDISAHTASVAWDEWNLLRQSIGNSLPVPDAAPGPEGQLLYAWNKEEHHLEAEIFPDDTIEFFYLNRVTNETWEKDCEAGEPISQDIASRLKIFI